MTPLLRGETDQIRHEVFSEINYHAAYEPQRSIRTSRYQYIRRFDQRDTLVLANCDDSPSKTEWMQHGWQDQTIPQEYLFDLVFDPMEIRNLTKNPEMKQIIEEMRTRLAAWMQNTNDPLLSGEVPDPPGSLINHPDSVSPDEPLATISEYQDMEKHT